MKLIALGVVGVVSLCNGARLNLHQQQAAAPFQDWEKDVSSFVCMQKWSKNRRGDIKQFCLVNLKQMIEANKKGVKSKEKYSMSVTQHWKECQDGQDGFHLDWAMKVCDLKGKADVRVSYSSKQEVAKSCFRIAAEKFKPDGKTEVDVLEAALSANDCQLQNYIASKRGNFAPTGDAEEEDSDNNEASTDTCPEFVFSGYCGSHHVMNCYDPKGAPPTGETPQCDVTEDYICPEGMKKCSKA